MNRQIEILRFVCENPMTHGWEIHKRCGVPVGTIYTSLQRMIDKGWIEASGETEESINEHRGRPRVFYTATSAGISEVSDI